jgi:hypothetical protein
MLCQPHLIVHSLLVDRVVVMKFGGVAVTSGLEEMLVSFLDVFTIKLQKCAC